MLLFWSIVRLTAANASTVDKQFLRRIHGMPQSFANSTNISMSSIKTTFCSGIREESNTIWKIVLSSFLIKSWAYIIAFSMNSSWVQQLNFDFFNVIKLRWQILWHCYFSSTTPLFNKNTSRKSLYSECYFIEPCSKRPVPYSLSKPILFLKYP